MADTVDGFPAMVVIYDPDAGSVAGGGTIDSPAGAYILNPSAAGRAIFGFQSTYQRGATAPQGSTEFRFQAANFRFSSTAYEWLVVSGARAQFKGVGTVNGLGNYGFMVTAVDGDLAGGGGFDKLRIKIWDKSNGDAIVYDNQLGASDRSEPTTIVRGAASLFVSSRTSPLNNRKIHPRRISRAVIVIDRSTWLSQIHGTIVSGFVPPVLWHEGLVMTVTALGAWPVDSPGQTRVCSWNLNQLFVVLLSAGTVIRLGKVIVTGVLQTKTTGGSDGAIVGEDVTR